MRSKKAGSVRRLTRAELLEERVEALEDAARDLDEELSELRESLRQIVALVDLLRHRIRVASSAASDEGLWAWPKPSARTRPN